MKIAQRYEIQAELGVGGMGMVYKGTDTRTSNTVAIKQLKPDLVNASIIERFKREGEALRELNHPNIVKMLDAVEQDGSHYLIMEYVSGGDLKDFIQQSGKVDHQKCVNMAIDLADALTRAHRLDIIHRDLKPANVLIGDDAVLRLTDFGVAHVGSKQRVTDTDAIVGTVDYLAPETLNGSEPDPRSDIWSFGVMLFEMLTGKHPFEGQTISQVFTAILTQPPPNLEDLCPDAPIALIDLVYRMLEKEPAARIRSVRAVGLELEDLLHGRDAPVLLETRFQTPSLNLTYTKAKHNLPSQTTPFVGREPELELLSKLIDDPNNRLITILAPGGMGKSRLSLAIAETYIDNFSDGVFFVELAPLSAIDNIPSAIATATGYQFIENMGPPRDQILNYLANKNLLLIMDNYEHLLGGADLVSDILQAAPEVKILATSRERLALTGEQLFTLSGMNFPEWETPEDALDYAAVKLFMQSAKRIRPDFELQADDLTYLARICRMVAGMPLAIVLAATWVESLELEEIAEELAEGLEILESELRDIPERQRSIQAVFDYSWNRLDNKEKEVFAKISVFRGGMTRKAAQSVTGAKLRQLQSLVNKGLLRRDSDTGRYHIHELARQYAEEQLEQLGEADQTFDAHMQYYADSMKNHEADLKGARELEALNDIAADFENVKVAWRWAVKRDNYTVIDRMLESFTMFCNARNQIADAADLLQLAEDWLDNAIESERRAVWGRVLGWHTFIHQREGHDPQIQYSKAQKAQQIAHEDDVPRNIAFATLRLALVSSILGRLEESRTLSEKALAMFRELGDTFYEIATLNALAYAIMVRGNPDDYQEAVTIWQEVVKKGRVLGNKRRIAGALMNLAVAEQVLPNPDLKRIEAYYLESLQIHNELGTSPGRLVTLRNLATFYGQQGKLDTAQKYADESLRSAREINSRVEIIMCLWIVAWVQTFHERYAYAKELVDEAISLLSLSDSAYIHGHVKTLLATVLFGLGEFTTATKMVYAEFDEGIEGTAGFQVLDRIFNVSLALAYHEMQYERSLELATLVTEHPTDAWWKVHPLCRNLLEHLKETLLPEVYAAAWERGKSLDLEETVKQLLAEFGEE